ncbi:MAG: CinA family nicotinamide mononucleotide deamidase-related protein [Tannerella sp.]|jgi:nicotinamide-nucleotide amidase|nr:CinA family nicotinamide mononucleotide deamidase-related protein [Tannerella sp.]
MNVEIITIGDELLIGQVIDTNSAFMAKALNDNGFVVARKATVGDNADDIIEAIDEALARVPIALITGGLGPTNDDITLKTLCRYFGCSLRFSEEVFANITTLFSCNNRVINDLTRLQAMVPDAATVIQNKVGTAPCTWFERNGKVLISLPGVPHEVKWLITNEIAPRLKAHFPQDTTIRHQSFLVSGYPESALAMKLADFENNLPDFVKLAYLPNAGIIKLRLTVTCNDKETVEATLSELSELLHEILGHNIIADADKNPEAVIGERLRAAGRTVGTAESCTGGAIAAALTSVAGASDYYRGSVVAYANEVKINALGVSEDDLRQHGAVSQQVVEQMARGALSALGCDYAIATSGIAGPSGGTPEKPVGTVWIAVASKDRIISKEHHFSTMREINILRTLNTSLIMLLEFMT